MKKERKVSYTAKKEVYQKSLKQFQMTLQLKKIEVNDRSTIKSLLIESWDTICTDNSLIDNTLFRGEEVVCDLVGIDKEKRLAFGFIKMAEQKDSLTSFVNKPTHNICLNCLGLSEGEKEDLLSF